MSAQGRPMSPNAITPEQRKSNARLGWLLGSIAVFLFIAFVVKSAMYGI
jgi:hypothetical protein